MNVAKTLGKLVFVWNIDLEEAARQCRVHRRDDPRKMEFDIRPLLVPQNNDGNFAAGEILLIANVFVGRQQQFKTGFLCLTEQLAVLEFVPADLPGERNLVPNKAAGNWIGRPVIRENSHPYAGAFSKL